MRTELARGMCGVPEPKGQEVQPVRLDIRAPEDVACKLADVACVLHSLNIAQYRLNFEYTKPGTETVIDPIEETDRDNVNILTNMARVWDQAQGQSEDPVQAVKDAAGNYLLSK